MQRRLANAFLKDGFSAMVSERALNILDPMLGSFAQPGTKPHLASSASRPSGRSRMMMPCCIGPRFQLGGNRRASSAMVAMAEGIDELLLGEEVCVAAAHAFIVAQGCDAATGRMPIASLWSVTSRRWAGSIWRASL